VTDQVPNPHIQFNKILEIFCCLKVNKLHKNTFSVT
jgi:hypothetical protein